MIAKLILLLLLIGVMVITPWAWIKVADRRRAAARRVASSAPGPKVVASKTEEVRRSWNESFDSDVFNPLRTRIRERIKEAGPDATRSFDPLRYLRDGDIDGARQVMQRLASLVFEDRDTHPEQAARFTALMCKFVQIDPLFQRELAAIKPVVRKQPGILQTQLYGHMRAGEELARYVLYFAHETGDLVRRNKGRTYAVFLPGQVAAPEAPSASHESEGESLRLSAHVQVEESESALLYAELNRQATQAKNRSYAEAVALLQEAKAIKGDLYEDTRLAKFLQQAGRFDEAMAEIQWLLDHINAQAQDALGQQPASLLLRYRIYRRAEIHKAAALICKRAKRHDLQAEHERQRDACMALAEKMEPVVDADQNARIQAWEAARAGGPQAMRAFFDARNQAA